MCQAVIQAELSFLEGGKKTLREKIYEKLLRIGLSYKESVQTSEIVQVAVEGVDQLETYFGAYLPQFFMPCWHRSHFCGVGEDKCAVRGGAPYMCASYSGFHSTCADVG